MNSICRGSTNRGTCSCSSGRLVDFSKSGDIDFGGIEGPEYAPIYADCGWSSALEAAQTEEHVLEDDWFDACLRLSLFSISDDLVFCESEAPEDASLEAVDCRRAPALEEALTDDFVLDLEINDFHAFGAFCFDFLSRVPSVSFSELKLICKGMKNSTQGFLELMTFRNRNLICSQYIVGLLMNCKPTFSSLANMISLYTLVLNDVMHIIADTRPHIVLQVCLGKLGL